MKLSDRTLRLGSWTLFACFVAAGCGNSLLTHYSPAEHERLGVRRRPRRPGVRRDGDLFPLVGSLIIQRQPRNRIGWVLNAIGLSWALTAMGDSYALWALVLHPGSLPGGEVVVAVNSAMWLPPILLMGVYIILLFPDGHLPSPRWRILAWGTLAVGVLGVLAIALFPGPIEDVAVPVEGEPDRRRGTRALRRGSFRGHPSAAPVGGARRSRRRRSEVSPGEWRCPPPAEVADGCGLHRGGALRPEHAHVLDEPVPDGRRLRRRGANVLPDGVDHSRSG